MSFSGNITPLRCFALAASMVCINAPATAQTARELAVNEMLRFSDETLDRETNTHVALCYVDTMTPEQLQIMANTPSDDAVFEVLLAVPMAATDCENAVVSEATGIEWRRP